MTELSEGASTVLSDVADLGGEGAGQVLTPPEPQEPEKPLSLRETVEQVVKEADAPKEKEEAKPDEKADKPDEDGDKAKDAKEEEKGKQDEKPAKPRDNSGKFSKSDEHGGRDPREVARAQAAAEQAPAKFQADAKERWVNVPNPVKRDIEVMIRDHDAEITKHREASERYERVREYDELARQNGREGIHETLQEVIRLEQQMKSNPLAALNEMLMRAGPRKVDGQPISLYELASAVSQMQPQQYQQSIHQAQQQQMADQPNPEVARLEQQVAQLQAQQVTASVIEPFKAEHPRYDELQEDIAFFLQSGKVNPSLSMAERLEVAYDMAVRINPASHVANQDAPVHSNDSRVEATPAAKSIKSAPGAVTPEMEPRRRGSIRDVLEDEARRQGIRR